MSLSLAAVLFAIGLAGSFLSGMVGIGGSIVKYPLILYVPPALGLMAFSPHEAAGITAVDVFFAALAGVWTMRRDRLIHVPLVAYMGSASLAGSVAGGYGGSYLSGPAVVFTYAVLASMAALLMVVPQGEAAEVPADGLAFNRPLAVTAAFVIGCASGIVGAGGAFLLVPVMLRVLRIPTRVTVASSLAITLLSSTGVAFGKIAAGDVPFGPAAVMVTASLIAAPLGARWGRRINVKVLQVILAVVIGVTVTNIWVDILAR